MVRHRLLVVHLDLQPYDLPRRVQVPIAIIILKIDLRHAHPPRLGQ